jgi:hypothetical protein
LVHKFLTEKTSTELFQRAAAELNTRKNRQPMSMDSGYSVLELILESSPSP